MKKFLLLIMISCCIPIWSVAQVWSAGAAENNEPPLLQGISDPLQVMQQANDYVDEAQSLSNVNVQQLLKSESGDNVRIAKEISCPSNGSRGQKNLDHECFISYGTNMYHFNMNDPDNLIAYPNQSPYDLLSAEYIDGQYYAITVSPIANDNGWRYLYQIDPETGAVTTLSVLKWCQYLSYNPVDGYAYSLMQFSNHNGVISKIDIASGLVISSFIVHSWQSCYMSDITIDNNGRCYALNNSLVANVCEIDLSSGNIISSLLIPYISAKNLSCDRESNTIYVLLRTQFSDTKLLKVDYDGGYFTEIETLPKYEFCYGCQSDISFSIQSNYNPNTPSEPTNLTVTPDENHLLSCNLSWTNPSLTADSMPLSDINEMIVMRNNVIIKEFSNVAVGVSMTYTDNTIPSAGTYLYDIYAVNDEGNGYTASNYMSVGCVVPDSLHVTDVTDVTATLSWIDVDEANTWNIEYGPVGFQHGEGMVVTVTDNSTTTITGLSPFTYYTAYVQSVCSEDNISEWSKSVTFATAAVCPDGSTSIIAQIGNGTASSNYIPISGSKYSYTEEIFLADELYAQGISNGDINTISYQFTGNSSQDASITILMANVSANTLNDGWVLDGLTEVFNGTVTFDASKPDNWNDIQLQNTFHYTGNNIAVVVVNNSGYHIIAYFKYKYSTSLPGARISGNDTIYDPYNPEVEGAYIECRNNVRFSACVTSPEYITVSGIVTSSYTQQPISGATITFNYQGVSGQPVVTNENGSYSIDMLRGLTYDNVIISANGYNTLITTYIAPSTETDTKNFVIDQPAISLNLNSIIDTVYFMQHETHKLIVNNNGTGKFDWYAQCYVDELDPSNQIAYAKMNNKLITFSLNNPENSTQSDYSIPYLMSICYVNGFYYCVMNLQYYGKFDPETGAFTLILWSMADFCNLAYNPIDGKIYGTTLGPKPTFYTLVPETGYRTTVVEAAVTDWISDMEFTNDGRCFVIDKTTNRICEVDLTTGVFTKIIQLDFSIGNNSESLDCYRNTNTLYFAANTSTEHKLYIVNLDLKKLELVGDFGSENVSCLLIPSSTKPEPWLMVQSNSGTIENGSSDTLVFNMDGWHAQQGTYTGHVKLTNNTINNPINLPVSFTILPTPCGSPTNFDVETVDFNNATLIWDAPDDGSPEFYNLYYDDEQEPFAVVNDTYYRDNNLAPGEYCYNVRAVYADSCISISPDQVCITAEHPYRNVQGTVKSSLTNEPIAGAIVTFNGSTTFMGASTVIDTTDSQGKYAVDLYTGIYTVSTVADNYLTFTIDSLVVYADPIIDYNIYLTQPNISIDSSSVSINVHYRGRGSADITISNMGDGKLTWNAKTISSSKAENSLTYIALNGTNICTFPLNDPDNITSTGFTSSSPIWGMCYVDSILYYATYSGSFGTFDPETGSFTVIATGKDCRILAYNAVEDQLYSIAHGYNEEKSEYYSIIYKMDPSTGHEVYLFDTENSGLEIRSFAFDDNGRCIGTSDVGSVFEINFSTHQTIYLFMHVSTNGLLQAMTYNDDDNLFYWSVFNTNAGKAQLYSIDADEHELTLIGIFQSFASGLAMSPSSIAWLSVEPKSGTIDPDETSIVSLYGDGWCAEQGIYNGNCIINNNSPNSSISIPVIMSIVPSDCNPVRNVSLDVVDYNTMHLSWTEPEDTAGLTGYGIYHKNDHLPFITLDASATSYYDENLEPGEYCYRVRAMYQNGCVSMSDTLLCGAATLQYGTVSGTVTNAYDGTPIAGAKINFGNDSIAVTDQDGNYNITLLVNSYNNIIVQAVGYNIKFLPEFNVAIYCNTIDIQLDNVLDQPANLNASVENRNVTLTWDSPNGINSKGSSVAFNENFDRGILPQYWTTIDADGDGNNWNVPFTQKYVNSTSNSNITSDNWLVTPKIFVDGDYLHYYVSAINYNNYGIYISTTGTELNDFKLLFEETISTIWIERTIDLTGCNGNVYIAFRHFNLNNNELGLDSVRVMSRNYSLTGYRVSRDGEFLADVDANILTYTDIHPDGGNHSYCVKALYDENKSNDICTSVNVGLVGDANDDGYVNVSDIAVIVSFILQQNPSPFVFENADVNEDGHVNLTDLQLVISIIMGTKSFSCDKAEVTYSVQNGILYMNTTSDISALQIVFDRITNIELLSLDGYSTAENITSEGYMFLAYNLNGLSFKKGTYALARVGDVKVNNFTASDPCGNLVSGKENSILGIENSSVTLTDPYPNPFNKIVKVPFILNNANANVEFVITDIGGNVVYTEYVADTKGTFLWTPNDVKSGVYFVNVIVNGINVQTEKVVYQK